MIVSRASLFVLVLLLVIAAPVAHAKKPRRYRPKKDTAAPSETRGEALGNLITEIYDDLVKEGSHKLFEESLAPVANFSIASQIRTLPFFAVFNSGLNYLTSQLSLIDITMFEIIFVGGFDSGIVVDQLHVAGYIPSTQKSYDQYTMHTWTFDDNDLITSFTEFGDTATLINALTPGVTSYQNQIYQTNFFKAAEAKDYVALESMYAPGAVIYDYVDSRYLTRNVSVFIAHRQDLDESFSNIQYSVIDSIADHTGTYTSFYYSAIFCGKPLYQIPSNGASVKVIGNVRNNFFNGSIVQTSIYFDLAGLLVQIGSPCTL
jgi:hypothetical protein